VIKSNQMRWGGHVAHMGAVRNANRILVGKLGGKRLLGALGTDGRIILKLILVNRL
jgi:hypothetical protein